MKTTEPHAVEKRRSMPQYCDRRQEALRKLGLPAPDWAALHARLDARRLLRRPSGSTPDERTH
jgi:hypothetical protein